MKRITILLTVWMLAALPALAQEQGEAAKDVAPERLALPLGIACEGIPPRLLRVLASSRERRQARPAGCWLL